MAVAATQLHDLRRKILRSNDPAGNVVDPRDDEPSALHHAVFLNDRLVACASIYPGTSPLHADVVTDELRFVAVEEDMQGQGVGRLLMASLEGASYERGAREMWANGRDTALGFYRAIGWQTIPGSEHLSPYTGIPHTVIWKTLEPPASSMGKLEG
jgi:GNAT superfamily N-acetyltransferase